MHKILDTVSVPIDVFAVIMNAGRTFRYRKNDRSLTGILTGNATCKRIRRRRCKRIASARCGISPAIAFEWSWRQENREYRLAQKRLLRQRRIDYILWWKDLLSYIEWWENVNLSSPKPRNPERGVRVLSFPPLTLEQELNNLDAPSGDADLQKLQQAQLQLNRKPPRKRHRKVLKGDHEAVVSWWCKVMTESNLAELAGRDEDFAGYLIRHFGKTYALKLMEEQLAPADFEAWLLREGAKPAESRRFSFPKRLLHELLRKRDVELQQLRKENEALKATLAKSQTVVRKPRKRKPVAANSNVAAPIKEPVVEPKPKREQRARYGSQFYARATSGARRG